MSANANLDARDIDRSWGLKARAFGPKRTHEPSLEITKNKVDVLQALAANLNRPAPVWNAPAFIVLCSEFGLVVLVVAITLFFQSRKRDFI